MNPIMLGAYAIVIIGIIYALLFKARGQPVLVILYEWRNKKRHYKGMVKGVIRKRYPESLEDSLFFKNGRIKVWKEIPDEEYFSTDLKGNYLLHAAIDPAGNVEFIKQKDDIFQKKTVKYEVQKRDENGKPLFEDVYVMDENTGEPKLKPVLDNKGKQAVDEQGNLLFEPVLEKQPVMAIVEKEIETPIATDRVIKSDRKLYYLTKKEEHERKYKQEEKNKWLVYAIPFAIIGIVTIATVYLTYKQAKEVIMDNQKEHKNFLQQLVESVNKPQEVSNLDPNKPKPADYGKEVSPG